MATQVILLEKIDHLGSTGDVVSVKPGYARNFLLPQNKALRATKTNIAYFEGQRAAIEKVNAEKKAVADKASKKVEGLKVVLIRQASEGGQLYGSVSSRDIAEAIEQASGEAVQRNQVVLNTAIKTIGLTPVVIALHADVKVEVIVNVARTADEAAIQEKTGKAVVAMTAQQEKAAAADSRAALMDAEAYAAEQEAEAEAAADAAEEEARSQEKSAKRAAKKAEAATEEDEAGEEEAAE